MKPQSILVLILAGVTAANVIVRDHNADAIPFFARDSTAQHWKRKGGGGSSGGGGGGGGGGRGGGSSSGSSSSGSSGSSSGSSGSSGSSSGSSSSSGGSRGGTGGTGGSGAGGTNGGSTRSGSGPQPGFRGFYGGGGKVPFKSGGRSPSGIAPVLFVGASLAFLPIIFLAGAATAYTYPFHHPYTYFNQSAQQQQTTPITCVCAAENVCACDDNNDVQWLQAVIGDGLNYNKSLVSVNTVNGTTTIYLNGNLPEGTTVADPNAPDNTGSASAASSTVARFLGFWPVAAAVGAMVFMT